MPCAMSRSVPSGCLSALWITVMAPIECSPSTSGSGRLVSRFASVITRPAFSEEIDGTELPRGRAHQRFAWRAGTFRARLAGAAVADVGDEILDLLLHVDHPASHL